MKARSKVDLYATAWDLEGQPTELEQMTFLVYKKEELTILKSPESNLVFTSHFSKKIFFFFFQTDILVLKYRFGLNQVALKLKICIIIRAIRLKHKNRKYVLLGLG